MRTVKKILAGIYLLAAVIALGTCALLMLNARVPRLHALMSQPAFRIMVCVAACLTAFGVLIQVLRTFFAPREPSCVRLGGDASIEVSVAALASIARVAAEREDIMVESVHGRVVGRDRNEVHFTIEAIAFVNDGLGELAARVQCQVNDACNAMLGVEGVTTLVRFLPSTTTVVSKEVSREQG